MTEKEIIQALKFCASDSCNGCPLYSPHITGCVTKVKKDALELINRQQAEIERLQAEIKKPVCMPGDTVYFPASGGEAYPATVRKIIYDTSWIAFEETAIGKQVFLTKEAAERAGADNDT